MKYLMLPSKSWRWSALFSATLGLAVSGMSVASDSVGAAVTELADPSADLPMATIEEVDEADLTPTRSVTPAAAQIGAEAEGVGSMTSDLPVSITTVHFRELMENSPFTRSLNLSDSLILTGVARFDGKPIATLMDRETKQTYVISDVPNPQGWKMVDISSGADLETVMAKISVAGGEVVTVRFDENRLKPGEAKPAAGPGGDRRRGGSREGETDEEREARHKRHEEFRAKYDKLHEDQKDKMRKILEKKREENPNMSREEFGNTMREAMDKVSKSGR